MTGASGPPRSRQLRISPLKIADSSATVRAVTGFSGATTATSASSPTMRARRGSVSSPIPASRAIPASAAVTGRSASARSASAATRSAIPSSVVLARIAISATGVPSPARSA